MFERSNDADGIRAFAKERKISRLIHFTPLCNLLNIYSTGAIWPRQKQNEYSRSVETDMMDSISWNDQARYDNRPDCINLSIQHINHLLLKRFQKKSKDINVWCVLEIDPVCLEKKDVVFTVGNAASSYVRRHGSGTGIRALQNLFADQVKTGNSSNCWICNRNGLAEPYPTSPQAEVLFPGEISIALISGVVFENEDHLIRARAALEINNESAQSLPMMRVCPKDFRARPVAS